MMRMTSDIAKELKFLSDVFSPWTINRSSASRKVIYAVQQEATEPESISQLSKRQYWLGISQQLKSIILARLLLRHRQSRFHGTVRQDVVNEQLNPEKDFYVRNIVFSCLIDHWLPLRLDALLVGPRMCSHNGTAATALRSLPPELPKLPELSSTRRRRLNERTTFYTDLRAGLLAERNGIDSPFV